MAQPVVGEIGDAQCCQHSNIADPFSDFFSLQKKQPNFAAQGIAVPARTHLSLSASAQFLFSACTPLSLSLSLSLCSVSVQRAADKSSALIQLNTDIMLLACLILHASIAEITAQLLSLSYV